MNRGNSRNRGFTLIELIVVIAIIGILATISIIGLGRFQGDTRDARRASSISVITEALEKYYDKNGEYPSCSAISSSTVISDTLKGVDTSSVVSPQAPSGTSNSIQCSSAGNTLTVNGVDFFEYQGDGSASCNNGGSCLSYVLKYKDEADGTIKTVASRRNTAIATSGDITDLGATPMPFTSIKLAWSPVTNASSYTIQRSATNNSFPIDGSFSSTTSAINATTASGLTPGTTYYFRVAPNAAIGQGNWSNIVTATTPHIAAPSASSAVVNAGNPSSQIDYSWNAVANAASYTVDYSACSTFCSGVTTVPGLATTSTSVSGLAAGTQLYFRVKAVAPDDTSSYSTTANAATYVPVPTGVSVVTNSSTVFTESWNAVSVASTYIVQCSSNNTTWGAGCQATINAPTTTFSYGGAGQGQRYYVRVQAVAANGTASAWSGSVYTATTIDKPATAALSIDSTTWATGAHHNVNYATYCPAGTTVNPGINYQGGYASSGFSGPSFPQHYWHPWGWSDWWDRGNTVAAGTQVKYWTDYNCSTAYATSPTADSTINYITVN